jgi:mannosyltransferase OCH1-like enzyme
MPELALKCIESWHKHMPDYEYKLWNEDNFDINSNQYVKEAYNAKKYAFVSDYVRLYALLNEGGIYMDTDVEVLKSYDPLLHLKGFIGFEGTKSILIGTGTIACHPQGGWVMEQIQAYDDIRFVLPDGSFDMTTNPIRITKIMANNGLVQNGLEQDYKDMHIFSTDYFCPRQTTGEYFYTENTYCDHHFMGSWNDQRKSNVIMRIIGQKYFTSLIKLKRKLIG